MATEGIMYHARRTQILDNWNYHSGYHHLDSNQIEGIMYHARRTQIRSIRQLGLPL
uniref:Uncharacterized protein n=1 Tax=Oryza brachyantha TaxID=4533 RepID=J3MAR8_ORYBR